MVIYQNNSGFELLTVIVNYGWGTKILRTAKKSGACGGTILLGSGTVKSSFLKYLGLTDEQKEIVLIIADRSKAFDLLECLNKEYSFMKPAHGIAFCTPVSNVFGNKNCQCSADNKIGGADTIMYNAIYVIVDRGNAEMVIDAAIKAGSTGATIINARGSGIHETNTVFSMEIEPEKEIVLMISELKKTRQIVASITEALQIDKPGNGIMFVQEVSKAYGL